MKTISLLCITLCLVSVLSVKIADRDAKIDWCRDHNDDECLCNKIDIHGPKIVLVNLDDHC